MGCGDLPAYFLRRRIPVINLKSDDWPRAIAQTGISEPQTAVCLQRLSARGRVSRIRRNLYLVVDPVREAPVESVASACFSHLDHYVTTDRALVFHRLIDQPTPAITVVTAESRAIGLRVRGLEIRSVYMPASRLQRASQENYYSTTSDGYPVVIATRALAVADALAHPSWMTHYSLLPEVVSAFSARDLSVLSRLCLDRSRAAAQRLGYLLEEAGIDAPPELAAFHPVSAVYLDPRHRRAGLFSTRWMTRG